MAEPWLKLHTSLVSNPKVLALPSDTFRAWILILLETKRYQHGGLIPDVPRLSYQFRTSQKAVRERIAELVKAKLLDDTPDGYVVHDWDEWQTTTPSETRQAWVERQRRSRARRKNVTDVTDVTDVTNVTAVTDVTNVTTERREEEIREEETTPLPPDEGFAENRSLRSHANPSSPVDSQFSPPSRAQAAYPGALVWEEMQDVLTGRRERDNITPLTGRVVGSFGGWERLIGGGNRPDYRTVVRRYRELEGDLNGAADGLSPLPGSVRSAPG